MSLLLASDFWNNWVAVTFLFVGIALLVVIVALLIIFRKKIIGSISSKNEARAKRNEEKKTSDEKSKVMAENVFKNQRAQEEAGDTKEYDPEFDKRINQMVVNTQKSSLNDRNLGSQTEKPKKEVKEEKPVDFNVMDQFKKKGE
ncbi:MAG: hypothetical protein LBN07_05190 [Christensenellaceae bacterium]|jgi:hypothetical protein|nr:hypothetical protein [Christensenellaceae bacterium]